MADMTAKQYVGRVRTRLCGYAPRDLNFFPATLT